MNERPIDTAKAVIGGKEREFLLTMGSIRRLKQRYGAKNINAIMERVQEEQDFVPLLFEALLDKDGMTEDQFADAIPLRALVEVSQLIAKLVAASTTDPTVPQPAVQ